jgi:2-hydroxychromene-2-carboxylate isomerase
MVKQQMDFYFDLMSPFSYLAHIKLPDLARKYGLTLAYHPMDIPQAKMAAGNYGPSNREVPAKIKVMLADLKRWAKRYDAPFAFPPNLQVGPWNVGVLYANDKNQAEAYVTAAYNKIWGEGCDPTELKNLESLAQDLDWDVADFMAFVSSNEGQTRFRKACVEAHQAGVFGAPIMMLDDEIWWGNDRFDFIEEYLQQRI